MDNGSTLWKVMDDGTSTEVDFRGDVLESNEVYCLVDVETKSIYIWLGRNADVRKRFVGARTASRFRQEHGNKFKVTSVDEGQEPSSFLNRI